LGINKKGRGNLAQFPFPVVGDDAAKVREKEGEEVISHPLLFIITSTAFSQHIIVIS